MEKEKTDQVRALVRAGEIADALSTFEQLLAAENSPFADDLIALQSRFSSWEREEASGVNPPESEKNAITLAALQILKKAESGELKKVAAPPPNFPPPTAPPVQHPPQNQTAWRGRFQIDGDTREYYLAATGQIFMLDPATRQPFQIAQQFASNDVGFQFAYFVAATNYWYKVDFLGVIWTMNPFGMIVRVGQYQPF